MQERCDALLHGSPCLHPLEVVDAFGFTGVEFMCAAFFDKREIGKIDVLAFVVSERDFAETLIGDDLRAGFFCEDGGGLLGASERGGVDDGGELRFAICDLRFAEEVRCDSRLFLTMLSQRCTGNIALIDGDRIAFAFGVAEDRDFGETNLAFGHEFVL